MKPKAHPFTLRQLQLAVALADTLNVGHAAALCRLQQPAFDAQLERLEDALGARLFERGRRNRIVVTPIGLDLVERARRLLADADDLALAARRLGEPLAGALRVGVERAIASSLLPGVTPALRARFPRLTPLWIEDAPANLLKSIVAGELDAALVADVGCGGDVERETVATDVTLTWPRRSPFEPALRQLADALRDAVNALDP